jgi:hypothetical protein
MQRHAVTHARSAADPEVLNRVGGDRARRDDPLVGPTCGDTVVAVGVHARHLEKVAVERARRSAFRARVAVESGALIGRHDRGEELRNRRHVRADAACAGTSCAAASRARATASAAAARSHSTAGDHSTAAETRLTARAAHRAHAAGAARSRDAALAARAFAARRSSAIRAALGARSAAVRRASRAAASAFGARFAG